MGLTYSHVNHARKQEGMKGRDPTKQRRHPTLKGGGVETPKGGNSGGGRPGGGNSYSTKERRNDAAEEGASFLHRRVEQQKGA